jgi:hypothetical protein
MTDEKKVKERAHQIWEAEGRPHGRDREHWEQAAREIAEERTLHSQQAAIGADAGIRGAEPPVEEIYRARRASPGATGEAIPAPRAKPKRKPRGG